MKTSILISGIVLTVIAIFNLGYAAYFGVQMSGTEAQIDSIEVTTTEKREKVKELEKERNTYYARCVMYLLIGLFLILIGIILIILGIQLKDKDSKCQADRFCVECGRKIPFNANTCPYCSHRYS